MRKRYVPFAREFQQSEWELVERFVREFRMKQEPNPADGGASGRVEGIRGTICF